MIVIFVFVFIVSGNLLAQAVVSKDSVAANRSQVVFESLQHPFDTSYKMNGLLKNYFTQEEKKLKNPVSGFTLRNIIAPGKIKIKPLPLFPAFSKPFVSVSGGRLEYSSFYSSHIDTPYAQKDLYQHQVNASARIVLGNQIPLKITAMFRRTNSDFFRNLNDVQVEFDVQALLLGLKKNALANVKSSLFMRDSIIGYAARLKLSEYTSLHQHFSNQFSEQNLMQANEMLNVPEVTWDVRLPDSLAKLKSDSLKQTARAFIQLYEQSKTQVDSVKRIYDSLSIVYAELTNQLSDTRGALEGSVRKYAGRKLPKYRTAIEKDGEALLPQKYRWLLGIRKFAVGKSYLNYSELSANNISIKGINVEYNSWYYLAFSAGVLDVRFRNIFIDNTEKFHQYLIMGRIGIGRLESNHFILSLFRGNKQSAIPGIAGERYKFNVTGMSIAANYLLGNNGYIKLEAGETVSPDFKRAPVKNTTWSLDDKTNKAYYVQFHYSLRKIDANVDGYYKYTGANFQSFSAYQANSALTSYSLKWDQYFFRKQLKISAGIKSNEFTNPFLVQQYKSNTVFKSVTAVFRKRKWPVLSVAYMPLSQYSVMGGVVMENRFNSLNMNAYHFYKLGDIRASSAFMLTRFYNQQVDSGFIYFNSRNITVNQLFNFKRFSAGFGISHSLNPSYQFTSIDQNIQMPVKHIGTLQLGVKINKMGTDQSSLGYYTGYRLPMNRQWGFNFFFEKGYIPAANGKLIDNKTGNIQLTKTF